MTYQLAGDPVRTPMPVAPRRLHDRDRATGRALIAVEPHQHQPLMHHVRTDPALAALDQLLDLAHERVDQLRPLHARGHRPPSITRGDIPADRLRIHARQRCCGLRAAVTREIT